MGLENDFSGSISDPDRVAAVRRTGLLDAPADHALDRLTRIACHVLRVPAALVCLVDDDRQFFASMEGLPEPLASSRQTPLTHSFCRYAVASRADFVVSDARQHEELRTHPAVTELGFVAYAGVPLLDPEGRALGTLCAIDHERRDWTEDDLAALHDLADFATERLRQRPGDLPAELEPAAGSARLSFDALPVMLWTVAPDGRCDYVNARWLEFTGRPLGAELGTEWTERIHPDDREERRERFQAAVTQRAPLQLEYRMRRYDDQYRWLLDLAVPRFGPDGEFLGLIGCSTDVTDRRQLEQRLVQAERAQAITQLAGGIAHDFNNLLTGIIGHVTLLEEEPAITSLAREDLGQIRHSAERAASLTRQLLAFSRRQVLAPRVLDLNNLVADSLSRVRRVVGEGVQVVWAPAASLDPIVADPTQIEQVLIQLSGTARDAMPNGGALELTTRQERLDDDRAARLSAPRSGTYVVLQARDTGRGMEAASLSRVFEPFSGARPSREDTGLGLASAYGIMKQSGGLIEVTSEPGRGTTFTLYFPRHEGSGPVGAAVGAREPLGGSETLLLVEDEEQVRELGRRVLERVGYTVLAAPDAESATAIADRHAGHIHLLITDMLLPQLSGRELAARLSIHRPAIKVLYISGTAEASIARLRLLEPGTRFLEKPFSLDRLLRTVRHALGDPESAVRPG